MESLGALQQYYFNWDLTCRQGVEPKYIDNNIYKMG
jgi:hypothetical protein